MNVSLTSKAAWKSWVELLAVRAKETPNQIAFSFLQEENGVELCVSYAQLENEAKRIATWLQEHKQLEKPVLLLLQPGCDYIYSLFGCWYAGAIAVPIYTPRKNNSLERVIHIAQITGSTCALTTSWLSKQLNLTQSFQSQSSILKTCAVDLCSHPIEDYQDFIPHSETTAILQFTSGSTSLPKGVILQHQQLLANDEIILHSMSGEFQHTSCSIWLPPYHDMGLIGGILFPIYAGFPVHLMSPAHFLQRPIRWLQSITKHQSTITAAPNFAYDLCVEKIKEEQLADLDLSSLKVAANGAEPIRAETLIRFAEKFKVCGFDQRAFLACYGMAEATLYVTGEKYFQGIETVEVSRKELMQHNFLLCSPSQDTTNLVSCGSPGPGVQIQIIDQQTGLPTIENRVGEIYIQSPANGIGYWKSPTQSKETFENTLPGFHGKWLRTGDLGTLYKGKLYVTGRVKDVIILHGQKHYPHDIERTLYLHVAELKDSRCVVFGTQQRDKEGVIVIVEQRYKPTPENSQTIELSIRQQIMEYHQLTLQQIIFVPLFAIPTTSSGKIQRNKLKQAWETNTLKTYIVSEEICL